MMIERRKHKRTYAWESARILFHKKCVLRCTICDASAEGARVELANAFAVPNEFELTNEFGDAHACSAVWKTPHFMGILFYDAEGRTMTGMLNHVRPWQTVKIVQ